mmetsp:Transcript_6909/g.21006  ORF Transcript_6909/g.21006 Transcript_6909/m.21006 type:complete len:188 (-) Transcript_6909:869-1432(-)
MSNYGAIPSDEAEANMSSAAPAESAESAESKENRKNAVTPVRVDVLRDRVMDSWKWISDYERSWKNFWTLKRSSVPNFVDIFERMKVNLSDFWANYLKIYCIIVGIGLVLNPVTTLMVLALGLISRWICGDFASGTGWRAVLSKIIVAVSIIALFGVMLTWTILFTIFAAFHAVFTTPVGEVENLPV